MATKVRPKLTTPQAQAMGLEAAREYERERQKEEAQAQKEAALEREKQDFMWPLIECGLSKSEAETAWREHIKQTTVNETEQLRLAATRRVRSRL